MSGQKECPKCNGTGLDPRDRMGKTCDRCNGTGKV